MRKDKKIKFLVICMFIMCMFALSGCKNKSGKEPIESLEPVQTEKVDEKDKEPVDNNEDKEEPIESPLISESPGTSVEPEMIELPIYSMNDESLEAEAAIALIPGDVKISAEVVVDAVVEAFNELSIEIGVEDVISEDNRVIVSFFSDTAPLETVGSSVEGTILDCLANSLLDNLDFCNEVVYRKEGQAYESGHYAYGIDEAYATE